MSGGEDCLEHNNWGELRKAGGDRESEYVQKKWFLSSLRPLLVIR